MTAVRPAEPADVGHIVDLLAELDSFYGDATVEPHAARARAVHEVLFGNPPGAYALLAWHDEQLAGIATYSFLWPAAGVTRSLYLEELFVRESVRRASIGKLFVERLHEIARERGCSRLEWTTESDNSDARKFYDAVGAYLHQGKVSYRVNLIP